MKEWVTYTVQQRVGYITLNRSEKRNALSYELVSELKSTLQYALSDETCKVIVLKSAAEAFCAGADLAYLQQLQENTLEENLADSQHLMELFQMIYEASKVVISQVEGPAIAGGCGLATVCDFCFATPQASFGYTEVRIGFIPAIVMVFLLRKTNEKNARELLLKGDVFHSEKALEYGLINEIIPSDEIADYVTRFAEKLCETASSQSLATIKEMLATVQHMSVSDGLKYAAEMNARARASLDCKKGIASFLQKEKLKW